MKRRIALAGMGRGGARFAALSEERGSGWWSALAPGEPDHGDTLRVAGSGIAAGGVGLVRPARHLT